MKTTHEIKKWLKQTFGMTTKGNTSSGKAQWQGFYVPCDPSQNFRDPLKYSLPEFPPEFRQLCLKIVYPTSPTLQTQTSTGNISMYSIAMLPHEWEKAITQWETRT